GPCRGTPRDRPARRRSTRARDRSSPPPPARRRPAPPQAPSGNNRAPPSPGQPSGSGACAWLHRCPVHRSVATPGPALRQAACHMTNTPSSLARRLGLRDAVAIGLGSMVGAGIFAAVGPAAGAARPALLLGLVLAAFVAFCNATSSAQLAALYPA